ncbi:MAG: 50S ribosomal protein L1 [Mycoplasmoidaceae bacterium]|nr:MAG: 50S ribosomal protein L1 [Mycoplasmoidaceae bacterium]
MKTRSKRYVENKKMVDQTKIYTISEACALAAKTSNTKFKSSIDLVIKLNLDTTKAEQQLRGNIALPHYFGKAKKVLVLDDTLTAAAAKAANVDYFGGMEQITKIKEGWLDYDVIVATPKFMPELSKLGKILGPKGLMPNPKLGTVTPTPLNTVKEIKAGKYDYRTDTYGNIHMAIAKSNDPVDKIAENIKFFLDFIKSKRPSTVKGDYFQKIYLHSSMGPCIKIQIPN